MTIWGSTTLRRLAMPLAVVSLGAALTAGWGQSLASSGSAASASDPNAIDPEVAVQSISFVLVPKGNDNFRPENACGGGPSLTTGTPPVVNPHPYGTGLSLLQKLSIGPTRCTLAIFTPNSDQVEDLAYSSTPCPVTTTNPVTTPNQSLKFVGLKNPNNLKACTAPAFLSTQGGSSPTTPDLRNPDLTAAQGAAGKLAVQRWAGSSCKPGLCRLIMTLVQKEGDFNAPGLCSSAFYLTGPCTVAVVATGDLNGIPLAQPIVAPPVVHATPGGARLDFSSNKCPVSTGLSNRGDISESCTNLPFNPADMKVLLPPAAQPAFETLLPCTTPPNTPAGCGPAKHSVEIAMQSLTLVVAPVNQYEFDPANACAIPGDTLSSLVVTRCTAAVLRTPVGFTGGTVNYPTSRCKLDLSAEFSGCFAQPFSPSKGTTAIKNLPPLVCRAPIPAIPPAAPAVLPAVACNIFVTLTHDDGDFNAENPCGSLLSGISSACLLASFTTDGRQQGDSITVNAATPVCPAGNGTNAVVDADVHDTCVSADSTIAAPFTAGSLANLLFLGTPSSMTVTIPEDRIV